MNAHTQKFNSHERQDKTLEEEGNKTRTTLVCVSQNTTGRLRKVRKLGLHWHSKACLSTPISDNHGAFETKMYRNQEGSHTCRFMGMWSCTGLMILMQSHRKHAHKLDICPCKPFWVTCMTERLSVTTRIQTLKWRRWLKTLSTSEGFLACLSYCSDSYPWVFTAFIYDWETPCPQHHNNCVES